MAIGALSPRARRVAPPAGQALAAAAVALFLLLFLVLPVATVVYVAFTEKGTGAFTLVNFADFARTDLFVRSFWNSLYVSAMSVVLASTFALPLAYFTSRFVFRGAALVQTLGFIPLIMPPFVGAVAMQLLFGRNGTVNLLLDDAFGIKIPFMEGLNGVIFVEAVHYFPFILINLSAALANIDRAMEEAAQNLGSSGFRLFRRIVLPLAMPGYVAGASLVFVKVFDDLATPLLLNVKDMLAPHVSARHLDRYCRPDGLRDRPGARRRLDPGDVDLGARDARQGLRHAAARRRRARAPPHETGGSRVCLYGGVPDPGSRAGAASRTPAPLVCDGVVLQPTARRVHPGPLRARVRRQLGLHQEHADLRLPRRPHRRGARRRDRLSRAAYQPSRPRVARLGGDGGPRGPGVVLGIGYLRTFYGVTLPGGQPLATLWLTIVLALAVRRLPYALRACYAALQQISVSLEEAAENLGATKRRTIRRVVVPLMMGGILAGFVSSFATAAVELSATLMLVQSDADAPLAYGLYVFMQSAAGRGPGAALGVIAVAMVALGSLASHLLIERNQRAGVA